MDIAASKLEGAFILTPQAFPDSRGNFVVTFHEAIFRQHGLVTDWVQDNQSISTRKGIVRGLHFQRPPYSETKLVRVVSGRIWDVFVDLRRDSPTYGQWDGAELSDENRKMTYIPKGFAHGFCTLSDTAVVLYKVDALYTPDAQAGLLWNDPTLNIPWPLDGEPLLSDKDTGLPTFADFDSPF